MRPMNHLGTKTLENDRLLLRRFKLGDAQAMYDNWASDPEVTRYLTWPRHADVKASKSIIKEWIPQYKNKDYYQWAIVLKDSGDMPIGSIGAEKADDKINAVSIGYCIGRKWWNRGITSEALSLLVRFFFDEVHANRIESRHDPRNPNSGKVMEKCGLRYEGTRREGDRTNQGICDTKHYAILAKDYRGK